MYTFRKLIFYILTLGMLSAYAQSANSERPSSDQICEEIKPSPQLEGILCKYPQDFFTLNASKYMYLFPEGFYKVYIEGNGNSDSSPDEVKRHKYLNDLLDVREKEVELIRQTLTQRTDIKWLGISSGRNVTSRDLEKIKLIYKHSLKLVNGELRLRQVNWQSPKDRRLADRLRIRFLAAILGPQLTVYLEDHLEKRGITLEPILTFEKEFQDLLLIGEDLSRSIHERDKFGGRLFGDDILRADLAVQELVYTQTKLANSEIKDWLLGQKFVPRVADSISFLADKSHGYYAEKEALMKVIKRLRQRLSELQQVQGPGVFVLSGEHFQHSQPMDAIKQSLMGN